MIQRVQSLWFLFASLALFALFLVPYLKVSDQTGADAQVKVTGVYSASDGSQTQAFTSLAAGTAVVAALPLLLIFLYKNRKRQLALAYLVVLLILAFSFWLVQTAKSVAGPVDLEIKNYGFGVLLPSLAILFIILGIRGIRNDEKLIKSADRLR